MFVLWWCSLCPLIIEKPFLVLLCSRANCLNHALSKKKKIKAMCWPKVYIKWSSTTRVVNFSSILPFNNLGSQDWILFGIQLTKNKLTKTVLCSSMLDPLLVVFHVCNIFENNRSCGFSRSMATQTRFFLSFFLLFDRSQLKKFLFLPIPNRLPFQKFK